MPPGKKRRGAVALMHVAIEDQYAADPTAFQQIVADHGQVVKNAEAGGMVIVRMVRAARQMAGHAVLQRLFGRQQRATHRTHCALRQGLAPRQAEAALVFAGQVPAHVALDVRRIMGQSQNIAWADVRAQQLGVSGQAAFDQVVAQQTEFIHRKAMLSREIRAVIIVVDEWQGHFASGQRSKLNVASNVLARTAPY